MADRAALLRLRQDVHRDVGAAETLLEAVVRDDTGSYRQWVMSFPRWVRIALLRASSPRAPAFTTRSGRSAHAMRRLLDSLGSARSS